MRQDINAATYRSLDDIRLRKAQLLTDITKDSSNMQALWDNVFHRQTTSVTPTSRFSGAMKTSAGIIDGLILGWKLYRKFGNGKKKKAKKSLFRFF